MIIIAFAKKTSKILPRIFCGEMKHVAPIIVHGNKLVLYQFIRYDKVVQINLYNRDIKILKKHGWHFVYLDKTIPQKVQIRRALSCVQMTKAMIGIKKFWIQTPCALYKELGRICSD